MFFIKFYGFSEDKSIILGGSAGWNHLTLMKGLDFTEGFHGYKSLKLASNSRTLTADTDLLLDFEGSHIVDRAGHYTVEKNSLFLKKNSKMGEQAGLSRGNGQGLVLRAKKGALFGSGCATGSFIIEFWLKPSIAENGEIILNWRSSGTNSKNVPIYQLISASFFNNHVEWLFNNVFEGYTSNSGEVRLLSLSTLVPDKWTHHILSFNEETGLLEYCIDEHVEALQYITSKGTEGGNICIANLGDSGDLHLCSKYTGYIDDFHIARIHIPENKRDEKAAARDGIFENNRYDTFKKNGGKFETEPLPVSIGSKLNSVELTANIPSQTDVRLFVRSGDNFFGWTEDTPKWIPVRSGDKIEGVSGRYFQISGNLYPDGAGQTTPYVTEIKLNYTELSPTLPPFSISADPEDTSVTLTWSYSVDSNVAGYYVYYGDRPGEYLGEVALEGKSPINVGNTTSIKLTGLRNGTIYYFAVASISDLDNRIIGPLSKEVSARPLKR